MTDTTTDTIDIFTDGSCLGNPGRGGWGALLRYKKTEKRLTGNEPNTTNNRMELTAVIKALEAIKNNQIPIRLYCDSKYILDGLDKYLANWQKNNWRTTTKKAVKNRDLWERLAKLHQALTIELKWIKGHSDHRENEEVDTLARTEAEKLAKP